MILVFFVSLYFLNLMQQHISFEIFRHTGLVKNWIFKPNSGQCAQNNSYFSKLFGKVLNFGKSLVASTLTCPLHPASIFGHQSLRSGVKFWITNSNSWGKTSTGSAWWRELVEKMMILYSMLWLTTTAGWATNLMERAGWEDDQQPPPAPVRLPPHQGLRLPRSLVWPPFIRKFGGSSFQNMKFSTSFLSSSLLLGVLLPLLHLVLACCRRRSPSSSSPWAALVVCAQL